MGRKRVLVVEDNPLNRDLLVQLLEGQCEVVEAENGMEAVALAHKLKPDLILMDLSLPVLNGWEATAVIKRRPQTRAIPVVAISARTMDDEVERARKAGVDDFIALPLDEERFYATVKWHLRAPLRPVAR